MDNGSSYGLKKETVPFLQKESDLDFDGSDTSQMVVPGPCFPLETIPSSINKRL